KKAKGGAVAGIVLGCIGFVALVGVGIWLLLRNRRKRGVSDKMEKSDASNEPEVTRELEETKAPEVLKNTEESKTPEVLKIPEESKASEVPKFSEELKESK
ncbi:hypothetical protein H4S08_003749, partial [Coemansia sp. RSA 1365]